MCVSCVARQSGRDNGQQGQGSVRAPWTGADSPRFQRLWEQLPPPCRLLISASANAGPAGIADVAITDLDDWPRGLRVEALVELVTRHCLVNGRDPLLRSDPRSGTITFAQAARPLLEASGDR